VSPGKSAPLSLTNISQPHKIAPLVCLLSCSYASSNSQQPYKLSRTLILKNPPLHQKALKIIKSTWTMKKDNLNQILFVKQG
jgi:hypothetical protein